MKFQKNRESPMVVDEALFLDPFPRKFMISNSPRNDRIFSFLKIGFENRHRLRHGILTMVLCVTSKINQSKF